MFTGCWQKSVHPFYMSRDVIFEEKLLGEWRETEKDDGGTTWVFSKGQGPNSYIVKISDKETKLDCDGRLFKLGDTVLMDFYSRNRSVLDMPAHTVMRVQELGASLRLQLLSPTWMKNRLQVHPKEIAHFIGRDPENPDDPDKGDYILTADTAALQKFLKEHMSADGFWEEPGVLKKVK